MDQMTVSAMMEVMKEFFPSNTSVAVSDHEKFIYYQPSRLVDLHIRNGEPIKEGSVTHQALMEKHQVSTYIDSDVYGIPYFAMSVPIFDKSEVTGAITTIYPAKPSPISRNVLTIKAEDRWYPIPYNDVIYLESEGRKTKVQAHSGVGFHKLNLTELEFMLPEDSFIRVHRSYIVNVHYIQEIQPDSHSTFLLIMKDRTKIPVTQTYTSAFRKSLNY
ncbi:LytTR family DNA-binding domain-containing protein [Domibacillus epiphyticus]|uniref:LytR family transcriptional regulator n=1 Tax=Domibacillus epiphyticus TaxID=1714355 RepID=A0A1V2A6B4_9BACI|nr:LytTR family DNA-binding domain-containing protein [Domibacillus epiphyticus]OMP66528.1 LytR family transcriptional regulator [Domibacillus epiphyticus]